VGLQEGSEMETKITGGKLETLEFCVCVIRNRQKGVSIFTGSKRISGSMPTSRVNSGFGEGKAGRSRGLRCGVHTSPLLPTTKCPSKRSGEHLTTVGGGGGGEKTEDTEWGGRG